MDAFSGRVAARLAGDMAPTQVKATYSLLLFVSTVIARLLGTIDKDFGIIDRKHHPSTSIPTCARNSHCIFVGQLGLELTLLA